MKITLKKLTLVNFKGIKNLEIDFAYETTISGRNATGKSTIFDSFNWVLFGKDAQDRKDFGVKTYDSKGVIIHKLDHEVHAILDVDGVETKLSRILREKWVKKRGEETPEFTGNETVYFINEVPKQQNEYDHFISDIIPADTFKLLTSPAYFNALKWEKRREMLIAIVGTPTDEELSGKDLVSLLDTMRNEKKSIDDMKKEYAAKKKKLKDELVLIPSRIDEVTRATPQQQDWDKIKEEINLNKLELSVVEAEMADKSKGVEEAVRQRSQKLIDKSNLEQKLSTIEFKARQEFANSGSAKDQVIATKKQRLLSLQQSELNYQNDFNSLKNRIASLDAQNVELRNKWTAKNAEKLEWNTDNTCPTCGQELPEEMLSQKIGEAELKFNASKTLELQTIQKYGTENKAEIEGLEKSIAAISDKVQFVQKDIAELQKEIKALESKPVLTKSVESFLSDNEEYAITKQKVSEILVPETIQQPDTTELQGKKSEIQDTINQLQAILTTKEMIDGCNKRKKELEAQEKEFAQQIASMEKIEYQIEQFTKRKVTEVEKRVNALFPTVRFRMFDQNINGGETPECICMVNGVPFGDVNSANKILAGLEIISVFSKVHDIYAPVFVDNSEGINTIPAMENQLVKMYVTNDKILTITL